MSKDLSEAFGTPAIAQLGGLLPRRGGEAEAPAPPPAPEPEPAPAPATPAVGSPPPSSPPAATGAVEPTSQVSVYLSPRALEAVRRERRRSGATNADLAFRAIDATIDRLPELLADRHTTSRGPRSLFPDRRRPRRPAGGGDPKVLWSLKATPSEMQVLDRLVEQLGAGSRSELVATAIEAHLVRSRRRS